MISVLIPSNLDQRLGWLKHALNFLYKNGFEGEVVVGVWGGHEHLPALAAFCLSVSNNIKIHAQNGAQRFTQRVLELAKQAAGKHIIQIGDDDFLVPGALKDMSEYLETHPHAFAVQGRTLSISHDPYALYPLPMWDIADSTALGRYANYCANPGQLFHAMLRRTDFIERMEYMDAAMSYAENNVWFEVICDFYTIVKGRFSILADVFILRSKHANNTSRGLLKNDYENMFPHYLLSPKFSSHYQFFQKQLFEVFRSKGANVDHPEMRREIQAGFLNLLGAIIYGRRPPLSAAETALQNKINTQHADMLALVEMVHNAKP